MADSASRSTSPSFPRTDSSDAAYLRELLLHRAHAVRLHAHLLRGDAAVRQGNPGRRSEHVVRAPVARRSWCPSSSSRTSIAALQEHMRVFSESYTNVGWNKGRTGSTEPPRRAFACMKSRTRSSPNAIFDALDEQHPDADTELHLPQRLRAARRHDPVGAVHRRSASTWSRRRCSSVIRTPAHWRTRPRRSSSRRSIRPASSAPSRRR